MHGQGAANASRQQGVEQVGIGEFAYFRQVAEFLAQELVAVIPGPDAVVAFRAFGKGIGETGQTVERLPYLPIFAVFFGNIQRVLPELFGFFSPLGQLSQSKGPQVEEEVPAGQGISPFLVGIQATAAGDDELEVMAVPVVDPLFIVYSEKVKTFLIYIRKKSRGPIRFCLLRA